MIAPALVNDVNVVRSDFLAAVAAVGKTPSFAALVANSERLRAEFADIQRVAALPRLQELCRSTFTCAIVGSSGDGKTSIMAELFPDLAQRGWLQTDKTDTTSQALVVQYAPPNSAELQDVVVHSWDIDQITRLVQAAESENTDGGIVGKYLPDRVVVDGTAATFAAEDRKNFKFALRQELRPLPAPYRLSTQERANPSFIRKLTVKEEASRVDPQSVLSQNGQACHTLQLRAIVKAISLRDGFARMANWTGRPAAELAGLVFVDTPGLNVSGSIKDEVLRNVLGKKNQQIVVELLRNDELDLIVHLVLCGNQSAFARLWRAVREQSEADEFADLGERLVLAINGTNIYFTNPDLRRKWSDPAAAQREGDHFAVTLDDNILKKMGESGTVRPARICFLDSQRIVESERGSYAQFYAAQRPVLEQWARPDGIGYQTLRRLGLLESYVQNINALCDPHDRGQGFLVRQIMDLAREKGPKLFLRKHLRRTRLHRAVKELHQLLSRYYDSQGRLNQQALQDAVRRCVQFMEPWDGVALEQFVRRSLDPAIEKLVAAPPTPTAAPQWVSAAFNETCRHVFSVLVRTANPPKETQAMFAQYFKEMVNLWKSSWGYRAATLPAPTPAHPETGDLLGHCLKFHVREMLHQLRTIDTAAQSAKSLVQTVEDQNQIRQTLERLDQAVKRADALCQQHGVPLP